MAFVPYSPIVVRSSFSGSGVSPRTVIKSSPGGRPRVVTKAALQEQNKSPGFSGYAEKLNGRMAMLGFTIALMTEIISPSHPTILAQVGKVVPLNSFAYVSDIVSAWASLIKG